MQGNHTIDNDLGCLVQEEDQQKDASDEFALSRQDDTPDPSTREQREQAVG